VKGSRRPFDRTNNPITALDYELAQETASTLGRMGRRLEAALQAIQTFDAANAPDQQSSDAERIHARSARQALVVEAGVALWHFIVQREACGLRDSRRVMRDYRVPVEVQNRVGALSPAPRGVRKRQ
jgi:hypothetical protein